MTAGDKGVRITSLLTIVIALAAIIYRFIRYARESLAFPFPLDYGEGAVLDIAARLAGFENIYPPDLSAPPWFVANYPPVYYVARAVIISIDGPALWHGRVLSQISAVATAILIGMVAHRMTANRIAGLIAGLTFLTIPFVVVWAQYDRVDMLALALNWAGLWLLVRKPISLSPAVACFVASSFTRQTGAFAGIAAGYVWLRRERSPAAANQFIVFVGGAGALVLLALQAATQGFVFHTIIGTSGPISGEMIRILGQESIELMPLLCAVAGCLCIVGFWYRPRGWGVAAAYTVTAALLALSLAKTGSYFNYLLDLCAALGLCLGVTLAWVSQRSRLHTLSMVALGLQIVLMARDTSPYTDLDSRLRHSSDYARLARIVDDTEGPVLADEAMALLPLEGRRIDFHPFAMTQLAARGIWNESAFVQALRDRRFPLVLVRIPDQYPRILRILWTEQMATAIVQNYHPTEVVRVADDTSIFVYRPNAIR